MAVLETKKLSVCIQGKEILHTVDLTLTQGRRTAIIGPNGSGKSTLLKALSGLLQPSGGSVCFSGREIRSFGRRDLAKILAVLPQGTTAPADLTVGELVEYGRFPHRQWWKGNAREDQDAIEDALRQTGTKHLRSRLLATLSGGERQRAWIAMSLAQQPKILLLDEPTTYLDIAHQLEVMQIITELNRKEKLTVVMVLHDLNHALQYADEVIVVKDGAVFASGAPEDVLTPKVLEQVFGVRTEIFLAADGKRVLAPLGLSVARFSDTI